MKSDLFYIDLEFLSLEETAEIPDFRDVKTIAAISNAKFLDLVKRGSPQSRQNESVHLELRKRGRPKKTTEKVTPLTTPKTPQLVGNNKRFRSKSMTMRSSTPLPNVSHNIVAPKSVQFIRQPKISAQQKTRRKQQESNPEIINLPRRRTDHRQYKDISPLTNDLSDLIPPDVDALGLEMDKLFLATPEAGESDYDSVSGFSSESDYYSCTETTCVQLPVQQPMDASPASRPGQKLDLEKVEPIARKLVKTLPSSSVYRCGNPNCCFTTSNATHLRAHCCIRA